MVSRYLALMKEGQEFGEGLILRGCLDRLAPVLMTASVAVMGLVPLALGAGPTGKEILHPLAVVVSLLGLVGTPPTSVFFGKLEVFTAAIDGGYSWLAGLAAANTVASLFYYLRWIAPVLLQQPQDAEAGAQALAPAGRWAAFTAYTTGTASVALGLAASAVLPLVSGHLIGFG